MNISKLYSHDLIPLNRTFLERVIKAIEGKLSEKDKEFVVAQLKDKIEEYKKAMIMMNEQGKIPSASNTQCIDNINRISRKFQEEYK